MRLTRNQNKINQAAGCVANTNDFGAQTLTHPLILITSGA